MQIKHVMGLPHIEFVSFVSMNGFKILKDEIACYRNFVTGSYSRMIVVVS